MKHTQGKLIVNEPFANHSTVYIEGKNGVFMSVNGPFGCNPDEQSRISHADAEYAALCWNSHEQLLEDSEALTAEIKLRRESEKLFVKRVSTLTAEIESLKAEKGMADMGFVSEWASNKIAMLTTEVAELKKTAKIDDGKIAQDAVDFQIVCDRIDAKDKQISNLKTVVKEYARHKKVECRCNPCVCGLDQALKGIL